MPRFTAITAMLESERKSIEQDIQESERKWVFLRGVIKDIANDAEVNGAAWASERAKRALAETNYWCD